MKNYNEDIGRPIVLTLSNNDIVKGECFVGRVNKKSLPVNYHAYDIRLDDNDDILSVSENNISRNLGGSFVTEEAINFSKDSELIVVDYSYIDDYTSTMPDSYYEIF